MLKKKKTIPLTNERHMLMGNYFCTHVSCLLDFYVSCLLDFYTDNVVSFDIKYFSQDLSAIILT